MVKRLFYIMAPALIILVLLLSFIDLDYAWWFVLVGPYCLIGIYDLQSNHNILRNYPVIGHFRYMFEFIRPEIQQYFVATNHSGRPFNREIRSVVYQRAKNVTDTLPFGTQQDIHAQGYEFLAHSLNAVHVDESVTRHRIGNEQCHKPYLSSRLNISGMSFGALSSKAVETLNWGAQMGGFAQNTGEGGLTPYHTKHQGDIIFQIGTGNFGCRKPNGDFCDDSFKEKAELPMVKMIEIKLSQGAKPSHGGLLPGAKVDEEIAKLRGIEIGKDCLSPPMNPAFSTPRGLLQFVNHLRELSNGIPVGFKLCIGQKKEFYSIIKAILETKIYPDFITIDGAEGGTGAAPLEFSNRFGLPINEALAFAHSSLVGANLRDKISLICSGKVATGFDMIHKLSIGADVCHSARAMLFTVGCIQSLKCNTNECPTGVATQDVSRANAIVPDLKRHHVFNYHKNTIKSFREMLGAMGLSTVDALTPAHVFHRLTDNQTVSYAELYPYLSKGQLLSDATPEALKADWDNASSERF